MQNGTFLEIGEADFDECLSQELLLLLSPDTQSHCLVPHAVRVPTISESRLLYVHFYFMFGFFLTVSLKEEKKPPPPVPKKPAKSKSQLNRDKASDSDKQRQEARKRLMAAKRAASVRQNSATESADSIEIYVPEAQTRL